MLATTYRVAVSSAMALARSPPVAPMTKILAALATNGYVTRTPDPVRDHRHERQTLIGKRKPVELRKIGTEDAHPTMDRREEKMILVVLANLSAMGDAVHVDLIVVRLPLGHDRHLLLRKRHHGDPIWWMGPLKVYSPDR